MASFVLAFRGQPDRGPGPAELDAWAGWLSGLGDAVTDFGHQVGQVRTMRAETPGDPATAVLSGYVVIAADDLDASAALAHGCPGLPSGVSVEVAEAVGS